MCSILLRHDEAAAADDIGCIVVGDVHDDVAAIPAPTKVKISTGVHQMNRYVVGPSTSPVTIAATITLSGTRLMLGG